MRLLLDTATFLWAVLDSPRLSPQARELLVDPGNEPFLSVVSSWEIAVKYSAGRLPLPESPELFLAQERQRLGVAVLPLEEEAALYTARLPRLHLDPFDRMLICQAIVHGLTVLTPDEAISQYPIRVLW